MIISLPVLVKVSGVSVRFGFHHLGYKENTVEAGVIGWCYIGWCYPFFV